MSRTTTALKRLGVPGLAVATIFAGAPAFFVSTASAATGDKISISPTTDSASTGTCNQFTVTVQKANNDPATSTVDVTITERNTLTADTGDVTFCQVSATGAGTDQNPGAEFTPYLTGPTAVNDASNVTPDQDKAEFVPNAKGIVVFGIQSDKAQTVDVRAFLEDDGNNTFNTGETSATAVKTFTTGGQDSVTRVTATPATATNFTGETHDITATAFNGANDTVSDAAIHARVVSGPNNGAAVPCGGTTTGVDNTNNNGQVLCSYSSTLTGTDTIRVFADQAGRQAGVFDTGEQFVEVTKTWQAAPSGNTIDLTCGDATTARSGPEDCFNQLSDNTETFSALVKNASGNPAAGVIVTFAVTGDSVPDSTTDAKPTLSTTEATTNASGIATVTLTDPQPKNPETITVTATVRGQSPVTNDDARKTFRTATAADGLARNIVLTPESATTTVNTFRTFTARVTNANGEPVQGVDVDFTESGPGAFRNGSSSVSAKTDINGLATVDVTAGNNETGTQTITASLPVTGECSKLAGNPTGSTAGNCTDTSTNTFVAAGPSSPPPTGSPAPGCSVAEQNLPVRFNAATANVGRDRSGRQLTGPTVKATALVTVTVTGARPGQTVELEAYQQNHFGTANFANAGNTRTAVADANGVATFQVRFSSNARARAKVRGCAFGAGAGFSQGSGVGGNVLYVRTVLTFTVTRVGVRTISISGDSLPARPGGLIVNIHCTDARCKSASNPNGILFQPRANATTGQFGPLRYTFARSFQNNTVVLYAATGIQQTGQGDAQNVAGRSNNRSVIIF